MPDDDRELLALLDWIDAEPRTVADLGRPRWANSEVFEHAVHRGLVWVDGNDPASMWRNRGPTKHSRVRVTAFGHRRRDQLRGTVAA